MRRDFYYNQVFFYKILPIVKNQIISIHTLIVLHFPYPKKEHCLSSLRSFWGILDLNFISHYTLWIAQLCKELISSKAHCEKTLWRIEREIDAKYSPVPTVAGFSLLRTGKILWYFHDFSSFLKYNFRYFYYYFKSAISKL